MPAEVRVAGVDAARGGWAVVVLAGGRFERAALVPELVALEEAVGGLDAVGVDIPIALPRGGPGWPRPADREAREAIGPRRASVFPAPPEPVLGCATYDEANRLHRRLTGSGLSRQAWALVPRIREARRYAAGRAGVAEVHPEVSFWALFGRTPLPWPKRTWNGLHLRRRLLEERAGIALPDHLSGRAGGVAPDDLLDAAAAAWSAHRVARGAARVLGGADGIRY